MIFSLVLCFIVILLILLFFRILFTSEKKLYNITESKIPSDLKSGDLVFVSYKNSLGKISKIWSGSKWTHVGIIYKQPKTNKVSILEVAEYNDPNYEKGVIEIPIQAWLKLNERCEIGYHRIQNSIDSEKLYELFQHYQNRKLYRVGFNPSRWKRFVFPSKDDSFEKELTCVEFVVCILQDLKLLSSQRYPSSYTISDLINTHTIKSWNRKIIGN